jgi:hypothetical protein
MRFHLWIASASKASAKAKKIAAFVENAYQVANSVFDT